MPTKRRALHLDVTEETEALLDLLAKEARERTPGARVSRKSMGEEALRRGLAALVADREQTKARDPLLDRLYAHAQGDDP